MTVDRFLAVVGPTGPERDTIVADAVRRLELTIAFEARSLTVLVGQGTSLFELGGRGAVVGGLFPNQAADTERLHRGATASGGRLLVDMAWGDYVALLTEGGDVHARVLRSPSGGLHAFVAQIGRLHLVASDVELILGINAVAISVDWNFVTDHLVFPHLRGRRTGLTTIDEIFPGDAALIRDTGYDRQGYWSPWRFAAPRVAQPTLEEAAWLVERAVLEATRRLSDRYPTVLLELSGGLDSSIVAAALEGSESRIRAVNFVTPTGEGDERRYARVVAVRTGMSLAELPASSDIDLVRALPTRTPRPGLPGMLRNWEEQLVVAASEANASAFFGGTGGDNVFCSLGSAAPATDALRVFGPGTRFFSAARAVARVHHSTVWSATWRALRQALRPRPPQSWPRVDDFVAPEVRPSAPPFHPWLIEPDDALPGTRSHIRSIMAAQAHLDGYLRHAVAPSVFPLLAQPVIQACLAVPTWTWIEGGVDRAVARHAFAARLPEIIVQRQTKGMMNAFSAQAYARNRPRLIPFLLGGHLARQRIIDQTALEPYLRQTGPVRDTRFYRVLALVDVELWLRGWLGY